MGDCNPTDTPLTLDDALKAALNKAGLAVKGVWSGDISDEVHISTVQLDPLAQPFQYVAEPPSDPLTQPLPEVLTPPPIEAVPPPPTQALTAPTSEALTSSRIEALTPSKIEALTAPPTEAPPTTALTPSPLEVPARPLPESSTGPPVETLSSEILTQSDSQPPSDRLALLVPIVKSDTLPDGSRKCRSRYREQKHYYLVKFKKDLILHVCQSTELLYQRRRRDSKIGPFAKYAGVWYECVVLDEDLKKSRLLQDMRAANKRSTRVITRRSLKSTQFALVQFYPTCDYQVLPMDEVTKNAETGMCFVACPDGVSRTAALIAKGDFHAMTSRQKEINDFQNLTTPVKKNLRNPLLLMTPRVKISPLPKKRSPFFKRSLSMQSTASSDKVEVLPTEKEEMTDQLTEIKILSPESLGSEQEQHDPFSTDSGSEYFPESVRSNCTSPAFSVSSELARSLNSPINEAIAADFTGSPEINDAIIAIPGPSDISNITKSEPATIKPSYKRKESACLYCKKLLTRISSHLQNVHKDQAEVAAAMVITDKRRRRDAWKKLRLEGNNRYNCAMMQTSSGNLILQRRNPSYRVDDYLPCNNCHGWFKRQPMYKHAKRCVIGRAKYERIQTVSRRLLAEQSLCKSGSVTGEDLLKKYVYPRTMDDDITRIARSDDMITKWGVYYCITHMQDPTKEYLGKVASQKMRQLVRLLVTLREMHGDECTLTEFLVPQYFNLLINAVRTTSGLVDGNYKSASLPISLGYTLKRCAMLLQGEASRTDDDALHKSSTRFLELLNTEWTSHLTSSARHQLKTKQFEKRTTTKLLPLVEDVMTFVKYLRSEEARLVEELRGEFLYRTWTELNKVLLCSLIVFNRKRVGDVEKIQISSYSNKTEAEEKSALYESLHPSERLIATSFVHMYTRGKKDSVVPIMMPKSQVSSFDLLVKFRPSANVSGTNKFLFAKGETLFMDGNVALRQLTKQSGAKNHHLLRSTSLRKQIATLSQVMNLKEGDLDVFAKYLGHSVSVHRNFYRLQDESLHLARISRLLLAVSTNNIDSIRGKSLDELPMPVPSDTLDYLIQADGDANRDVDDEDNDVSSRNTSITSYQKTETSTSTIISSCPNSEVDRGTLVSKQKPPSVKIRRVLPASETPRAHRPWSPPERHAVIQHLAYCVQEQRIPNKAEIIICLQQEPVLRTRTWRNIKDYVRNMINKKKR